MNDKLLYTGQVIDNLDPRGLGRVRVEPDSWYINFEKNIRDFDEKRDKWKDIDDPFVFKPLIPNYINIVPKNGEPVLLLFVNNELQHFGGYYIPTSITDRSKPDTTSHSQKNIEGRDGINFKKPVDLYDNLGSLKYKKYEGAFPTKDVISYGGRENGDLRFTDKSTIIRSGQLDIEQTRALKIPIKDDNPAMIQLSLFDDVVEKIQTGFEDVISIDERPISSVLEYDIKRIENGSYKIEINLYDVSNSSNVNTKNMGILSKPNSSFLVLTKTKQDLNDVDSVVSEIRHYIKILLKEANNGNHGNFDFVNNNVSQTKGMKSTYPFYFRPTKELYESSIDGGDIDKDTLDRILIKTKKGFGLIFSKTKIDPPKKNVRVPKYSFKKIDGRKKYITQIANTNLLLSYDNNPPVNDEPIDYNKISNNEITSQQMGEILVKTFSMVRGEKLYELLSAMYYFLVTHVHNPAEPGVTDPTIRKTLDEKFQNFAEDILSTKNRLN